MWVLLSGKVNANRSRRENFPSLSVFANICPTSFNIQVRSDEQKSARCVWDRGVETLQRLLAQTGPQIPAGSPRSRRGAELVDHADRYCEPEI